MSVDVWGSGVLTAGEAAAAVAEARRYLRIDGGAEDAVLEALTGSAAALCETFVGQLLVTRKVMEIVRAGAAWTRLSATPVRAITTLETLTPGGAGALLPAETYEVDIDANGDGWIRLIGSAGLGTPARLRVGYQAGLAAGWATVPEALRGGIVRLAAYMYADRADAGSGQSGREPPASVAALWRPYRRMRLR